MTKVNQQVWNRHISWYPKLWDSQQMKSSTHKEQVTQMRTQQWKDFVRSLSIHFWQVQRHGIFLTCHNLWNRSSFKIVKNYLSKKMTQIHSWEKKSDTVFLQDSLSVTVTEDLRSDVLHNWFTIHNERLRSFVAIVCHCTFYLYTFKCLKRKQQSLCVFTQITRAVKDTVLDSSSDWIRLKLKSQTQNWKWFKKIHSWS